ncbi:MAG TPA: ATP-binding protein [Ignavibacteria bacterium]|nr:ATP-binding protein [Ignavibacteria bacterium]
MIQRKKEQEQIKKIIDQFPVTAILGPRQCGKTTLAKEFSFSHYFDLENPRDLARLDNPQFTLEELEGLIVIDEIQRKPELFPLLRYLTDNNRNQKYLILGSASRNLIKQSSETLAGRIAYHYLSGFNLNEVGKENWKSLWLRGGLPLSFLATNDEKSFTWREHYITTFLERDIPQLGISIPANTLRRFWIMVGHYNGSVVNFSEISKSFGVSDFTVRKYIEILENTFTIRLLQPWYQNVKKRLVKRPKLYIRDSGIFHALQTIETSEQLLTHPKLGASWESFALENVILHLRIPPEKFYFWRTHNGAEVDLFWQKNGKNWAIEFKFADAPRMTKSIHAALRDLELEHLWIFYPGKDKYRLSEKVTVFPLSLLDEFNY